MHETKQKCKQTLESVFKLFMYTVQPVLNSHPRDFEKCPLNPLTPGTFLPKLFFFDILVVLKLDCGQISFSLVENALVARPLAVLATRIAPKTFWPRHAQKSKF